MPTKVKTITLKKVRIFLKGSVLEKVILLNHSAVVSALFFFHPSLINITKYSL